MKTTAAKIATSALTALVPALFFSTILASFWHATDSPKPLTIWTVAFVVIFLGNAAYHFRGWTCKACGTQGMWCDAKIANLSDKAICNHCNEYLE